MDFAAFVISGKRFLPAALEPVVREEAPLEAAPVEEVKIGGVTADMLLDEA